MVLTEAQQQWAKEQAQQAVHTAMHRKHHTWKMRNPQRKPHPTALQLFRYYLQLARYGSDTRPAISRQYASKRTQPEIRQVLWVACLYWARDSRFLALNPRYSFDKGMLYQGGLGTGKTTLLELFSENPVRGYSVTDTATLNKEYLKAGPLAELHKSLDKPAAWGIDELGQEAQTVQYMGNWVPVLEEVLSTRARLAERYPNYRPLLHATTNLPILRPAEFAGLEVPGPGEPNSIELHYGNRVLDRFKKMFNQVEMPDIASFR